MVAVCLGLASPTRAELFVVPGGSPFDEESRYGQFEISGDAGSARLGGSASGSVRSIPESQYRPEIQQAQAEFSPPPMGANPLDPSYFASPPSSPGGVGFASMASENKQPFWRLGRTNLDQYGYDGGYTNFNVLVPLLGSPDDALTWINPRINVTDYGVAAANIGAGIRKYNADRDRVYGASIWWDWDDGHVRAFNQVGGSFESIGNYYSLRGNFGIPVGETEGFSHATVGTPDFVGHNIAAQVTRYFDNAMKSFDIEMATPMPGIGKYGFEWGLGVYHLTGENIDTTGGSARLQAQISENLWMNGIYTYDDMFQSLFSLNFEYTFGKGLPRRFFRRAPVQSYMTQSVQRRYRIPVGKTSSNSYQNAQDPNGVEITIAYIDPNAGGGAGGDGTIENPYQSLDAYETSGRSDEFQIIFVYREDGSTTGRLDTGITLVDGPAGSYTGQRLFGEVDLPAAQLPLTEAWFPGYDAPLAVNIIDRLRTTSGLGGARPTLSNSAGVGGNEDVIKIAGNSNEVFGFTIDGSDSGSGIVMAPGTASTNGFYIHGNNFQNVVNGIDLVSDTSGPLGLAFDGLGVIAGNNITAGTAGDYGIRIQHINGDGANALHLAVSNATNNNGAAEAGNLVTGFDATPGASAGIFILADGPDSAIVAAGTVATPAGTAYPVQAPPIQAGQIFTLGVSGNTVDESGTGIGMLADNGATITANINNNTVTNSTDVNGDGIAIQADNASTFNVITFNGNTSTGNAGNGVIVQAENASTIEFFNPLLGNQFNDNAENGMFVDADGAGSEIIFAGIGDGTAENANQFNENDENGLSLNAEASGTITFSSPISGNEFNGNGDNGLLATANNGTIEGAIGSTTSGNTFNNNGFGTGTGAGIAIFGNGAGTILNLPILNNTVNGNAGNGITFSVTDMTQEEIWIQGNTIVGNGGDGIWVNGVNSTITNLLIVGNPDIRSNAGHGINLQMLNSLVNYAFIDNNGMGTLPPPASSLFDITLVFDGGLTPSQQAIFALAEQRWEEIITGDLPDVGAIDDVLITASGVFIDGAGGILGQAGPTALRMDGSYLPYSGIMQFDSADLAAMESSGELLDVILHEMGHVLGIGTIWELKGLLNGAGTANPVFTGSQAVAQYNSIFGTSGTSVPVEFLGGPGTADSHWRESVFNNELMTGYINSGVNPLSAITIAQMADLGYQVDMSKADSYTPPAPIIGSPTPTGVPVHIGHTTAPVVNTSSMPSVILPSAVQANGLNGVNIELTNSSINELVISRNIINDHANGTGIEINAASGSNITEMTINNNLIDNNQFHGINIIATGASTLPGPGLGIISNNTISNQVTGDGVRMLNPDTGASPIGLDFVNNVIQANAGAGVNVELYSDSGSIISTFTGNTIEDNGSFGVTYSATQSATIDLTIGGTGDGEGNVFDNNADANIALNLYNDVPNTISRLVVQNNAIINARNGTNTLFDGEGISIFTGSVAVLDQADILNNLISGNAGDGIEVLANGSSHIHAAGDPTSPGLLVQGNEISNNGRNGIEVFRQGDAIINGQIGTADGVGDSQDGNLIVNNGISGIYVEAAGVLNGTYDGIGLVVGQNWIAGNAGQGVDIVTGGTANARVDLLANVIQGTYGTGGSTQVNGIRLTTNDVSYFGGITGTNALWDGNVVTGHSQNGVQINRTNTGAATSQLFVDIFGNIQLSQIMNNGANGIQINDNSNQQLLDPSTINSIMEINVGDPASSLAGPGSNVPPARPNVVIAQNGIDAFQINQTGTEILVLNIDNVFALGGQQSGTGSRFGLSFNGNDTAIVRGADTFIQVANSTFTGFGDDGMHFFFDTAVGNRNGSGENPFYGGTLNVLVQNSIIGQNESSFNGGDGVDIEIRDNGSNFVFDGNVIQNNQGDGFRMSLHAEQLTSGVNGSANRPQVIPNRDSTNDAVADTVTWNNPELVGMANYDPNAPFADQTYVDVIANLQLTNNQIRYNANDGVHLALGAGTSLGEEFAGAAFFINDVSAVTFDARLNTTGHAIIAGNDMSGNSRFGFYTRTQDALASATVGTSSARTTATATPPANRQTIQLDPLAHMWLDFDNNIGSVLNPTVVGGVYNADPTKSPGNRQILTNFNVYSSNWSANVFTQAGGAPDVLTAFQRFQQQWDFVITNSAVIDSGANSPQFFPFINASGGVNP